MKGYVINVIEWVTNKQWLNKSSVVDLCNSQWKAMLTRKSLEAKNAPQMAIVYKRQNLYSNTTCTPTHDKKAKVYKKIWGEIR